MHKILYQKYFSSFHLLWLTFYFLTGTSLYAKTLWTDRFITWITFDAYKPKKQEVFEVINYSLNDDPQRLKWVKGLTQTYPELAWFSTSINDKYDFTEPNKESWSYHLYGHQSPIFDKIVLSIWALRAIYNGSPEVYHYFTRGQNPRDVLSHNDFMALTYELTQLLDSFSWIPQKELLKTLELSLILSEIVKTERAQSLAKKHLIYIETAPDFLDTTLSTCPQIYPSLSHISFPCKQLLQKVSKVTSFHSIFQLEAGPDAFDAINTKANYPYQKELFDFVFFTDICYAAGLYGDRCTKGCAYFTKSMYETTNACRLACLRSKLGKHNAYLEYLEYRAKTLGFTINTSRDRVLTRLGTMLNLYTPRHGELLRSAFMKLNICQQALIISQFDPRRYDPLQCTPLYIPNVLKGMMNHRSLGYEKKELIEKTFILALPFIAETLKNHRQEIREKAKDSSLPLDFSYITTIIKDNPYILNYVSAVIDERNRVKTHY